MALPTVGNVGENTKHYLELLDKYRDQPEYSYRYHHWVVSAQLLGPVDPEKFEAAFKEIVQLSPVLRSYFAKQDDEWKHIILPSLEHEFFTYKKHGHGTDWRAEIGKLTQDLNEQILPVDSAPIFKVFLQEFDEATIVTMHIHHLLIDGWGTVAMYQKLLQCYEAALSNQPAPVASLTDEAFLEIVLRDENQWIDLADRKNKLEWWSDHIGDHAYVANPVADPPAYLDISFGRLTHDISNKVLAYAEKEKIHFSYIIRAAYVKALQDWTGNEDVLMTSVKANRSKETGDIIANLAHWMISRHRTPRDMPLRQMAKTILDDTNECKERYLPYWDIVNSISPDQYFSNFGIIPCSFNYLPPFATKFESGGSVSLCPLFEFAAFSPRLIANEFFPRCLMSLDPETQEEVIAIDLGYNREIVATDKAQAVLDQIIGEVSNAFR